MSEHRTTDASGWPTNRPAVTRSVVTEREVRIGAELVREDGVWLTFWNGPPGYPKAYDLLFSDTLTREEAAALGRRLLALAGEAKRCS